MIRIARLMVRLVGGPERRPLLLALSGLALLLLARRRQWSVGQRKLLLTLGAAVLVGAALWLLQ